MSLYRYSMRNASLVLFWMAFVIFFSTFIASIGASWQELATVIGNPYAEHRPDVLWMLLQTIGSAVLAAAVPFFGASLLNFLDQRLPMPEAAE